MPLLFAKEEYSSLFGVGYDIRTHSARLEAADYFYQIRKRIEKSKTRLNSLTARDFKKHQLPFRETVAESLAKESGHRQLLLPLILDNPTEVGIKCFILACFTLSSSHVAELQKKGLMSVFPQLFSDVAGDIAIPPETLGALIDTIVGVCGQQSSPSSAQLLGQS